MAAFEIFDKLNELDAEDGGQRVAISVGVLRAQTCKQGGEVTVGVTGQVITQLMIGTHAAFLVIYDKAAKKKQEVKS